MQPTLRSINTESGLKNFTWALITSFDLGSIWLGVYPREDRINGLKKLLEINDENIIPFSLIPIGYPAEKKDPKDIYDEHKIHYNKW